MKLRLRVWLAGLALCLFPTFAQAQHFLNQCSHAPIPICADMTPTDAAKVAAANALAGIEYCVPEGYALDSHDDFAANDADSDKTENLADAIEQLASEEPLDVNDATTQPQPSVEVVTEVVEEIAEPAVEEVAEVVEVAEPAVEEVAEVVEAVEPAVEEVAEVVEAAEPTVEEIAEVVEAVEPAVEEVAEVVEAAEPAVEEIAEVVEAVEPAVEEVAEVVEAAEPAVEEIAEVVEAAEPAMEEIAEVVEAIEPAVEEVAEVVEAAEPAMEEIAEVAEAVEPAMEEIVEVVEAVEPAVEEIAEVVEAVEPAVEEVAEAQLARLMDAPIICTLRDPEEYLPYDLTATDALQWQIFADGIPRPSRGVQIPLRLDAEHPAAPAEEVAVSVDVPSDLDAIDCGEVEPYASAIWNDSPAAEQIAVAEAVEAEPIAVEVVAAETVAVEAVAGSSIDCLLDELVWQTSDALRPDGWLRSSVQPEAIGEHLLSATQFAGRQADSLLNQLAQQMPVQPALVGPPAPAAAVAAAPATAPEAAPFDAPEDFVVRDRRDTPQVCCPLEDFSSELEFADAGHDDLESIDENLQAVLDFVRSIASPFQPRIADGGQETDTLAR